MSQSDPIIVFGGIVAVLLVLAIGVVVLAALAVIL
jgi:hypothetical protein